MTRIDYSFLQFDLNDIIHILNKLYYQAKHSGTISTIEHQLIEEVEKHKICDRLEYIKNNHFTWFSLREMYGAFGPRYMSDIWGLCITISILYLFYKVFRVVFLIIYYFIGQSLTLFRLQNNFLRRFYPSHGDLVINSKFIATLHPTSMNNSNYSGSYFIVLKETMDSASFIGWPMKLYTIQEAYDWQMLSGIKISNYTECMAFKLNQSDLQKNKTIQSVLSKNHVRDNKTSVFQKGIANKIISYMVPTNSLPPLREEKKEEED